MTGPGVFRLNPAGRAERQAPLPAGEGPSGSGGLKQGGTAFLTPLTVSVNGQGIFFFQTTGAQRTENREIIQI